VGPRGRMFEQMRRAESLTLESPGDAPDLGVGTAPPRVGPPPCSPLRGPRDRPVRGVNRTEGRSSNRLARQIEAEQDRELVLQAQRGDSAAFRTLVQRHQRRAFAIAVAMVQDEDDALEVVQEAFLRVHRGLDSFHGGSSFFTWLYRIVTNLSIDLLRKPARREAELSPSRRQVEDEGQIPCLARLENADPLGSAENRELQLRIQAALDALPPYHRGVILMREVEGMSYEEMAQAMGVSKGTIMSRLFHARQKLMRALGEAYEEACGKAPPGARGESP
jgi:RNA polymerase sigma-70 factor (ECF subfamily)